MALIDDFKARFPDPEFTTATVDAELPPLIAVYNCYYGGSYGSNTCDDEIILNLLAHLLTVLGSTSDANGTQSIASESVGSVSRSFSTPTTSDDNYLFFNTTKYGKAYLMLTAKNAGGYFV